MAHHTVKIRSIKKATHDVLQIVTDKPSAYTFVSGQATDVSINNSKWKDEKRPFTFTSLPSDDLIEFTIKTYPKHESVTNELLHLKTGDELILHDVFGDIAYKGEGVFIAGGAGVTPFISIFRNLHAQQKLGNNTLIFANKTKSDIILEEEFKQLLGNKFINILSEEKVDGYANGYITAAFLNAHTDTLNHTFYLCGPPPMMDAVEKILADWHVDDARIVKEGF